MTGVSFDDLVAVATVGVARKGRPAGELAGPAGQAGIEPVTDPAAALLDAAALLTAARRAGVQPARAVALAEAGDAAPGGTERELTFRAARLLRRFGPADGKIVAVLLAAAQDAGYVLPAPLLPALLDAAVRDAELRPAVAGLLGTRGRWLAAHRADWRRAVGQGQAALEDRASGVRGTARELLARVPGSAFSRRAAERAAPLLRVERQGLRRRLAVTLPAEPDPAGARDGVPFSSEVKGIGDGAWRLIHVLAAAPLGDWTRRLGLRPAELAGLSVTDDLGDHVHAGWRRAVVRQRGAGTLSDEEATAWALALLSADSGRAVTWGSRAWPDDVALAAALPAAARADRAAALLKQVGAAASRPADWALAAEVDACPVPWPPALADAVLAVVARTGAAPEPPSLTRRLLNLARGGLPASGPRDYAAELARLPAAQLPSWSSLIDNATEAIAWRRAFLAELRPAPLTPMTLEETR